MNIHKRNKLEIAAQMPISSSNADIVSEYNEVE